MERHRFDTFEEAGITKLVNNRSICPNCSHTRKPENRAERCVEYNPTKKRLTCHNGCGFYAYIGKDALEARFEKKEYVAPRPLPKLENPITEEWQVFFLRRGITLETLKLKKVQCLQANFKEKKTGNVITKTAIAFPYYLDETTHTMTKMRSIEKENKSSFETMPIPYNFQTVTEKTEKILWVEGEIDCLSWVQIGAESETFAVLSIPSGANGSIEFLENIFERILNIKKHIIAMDDDMAGIKMRNAIVGRLGADICEIMEYPYFCTEKNRTCKDSNEVLAEHGDKALLSCLEQARPIPVTGEATEKEREEAWADIIVNGRKPFEKLLFPNGLSVSASGTTASQNFDNIATWNIGQAFSLITGAPGSAKTQFSFNVAVRLSILYGVKWVVMSPETGGFDSVDELLANIFLGDSVVKYKRWNYEQAPQNLLKLAFSFVSTHFKIIKESDMPNLKLQTVLDTISQLKYRYGCKGAIIDPWNALDDAFGENISVSLNERLNSVQNFTKQNDMHVIVVAHPSKLPNDANGNPIMTSYYQINGGAAWGNKCDNIFIINRDYGTGDKNRMGDNVFVKVDKFKKSYAGSKGEVKFSYCIKTGRFGGIDEMSNRVFHNYKDFATMVDKQEQMQLEEATPRGSAALYDHFADRETKLDTELGIYIPINNIITLPTDSDEECPF